MEIERKFKIESFPVGLYEISHIQQFQGYLSIDPEVRIRHTTGGECGDTYILCIKSVGDLVRHEVETSITKEQFEELAEMLEFPLIHKDQKVYLLDDGLHLECSIVDDGAFAYAEVEFSSEEEANKWVVPDYLGEEMTYQGDFRMRLYWGNRELAKRIAEQS